MRKWDILIYFDLKQLWDGSVFFPFHILYFHKKNKNKKNLKPCVCDMGSLRWSILLSKHQLTNKRLKFKQENYFIGYVYDPAS